MNKKNIVELTEQERSTLKDIISKMNGSKELIRRAYILLMSDKNGANWTDENIAKAYQCSVSGVYRIRERFVTRGFKETLYGKKRENPPNIYMTGDQEAKIIALRLSSPPPGFSKWSLRLLANKVVELGIMESVTPQTIGRKLKKMT